MINIQHDYLVGAIGVFGAILGAICGSLASTIMSQVSILRTERLRILIEIEEYLDELWSVSNSLYYLKDRQMACFMMGSEEAEEKEIESAYNNQFDKFFLIWDKRKRFIELKVYFNDPECAYIFRKIERLFEKSKNKIEAMSPFPIIDNDKLLEGLLEIKDEIYELRENLSNRLKQSLAMRRIFFPTFLSWYINLRKKLKIGTK